MRYAIDVRATRSQSHFSIPTKVRACVSAGAMGACHPHYFGKLGLAPADFISILMAPLELPSMKQVALVNLWGERFKLHN